MLIWQYLHEGVPNHYLFRNSDLPAISNWWGGLVLPALSWVLAGRIQKRMLKFSDIQSTRHSKITLVSFVISLVYGALLSLAFIYGYREVYSVMFPGILLFAAFFKVYREEFLLGFILSMSITFGAVLSILFCAIIASVSVAVYFSVQFIWVKVKNITLPNQVT
jgi:hypothetical protein